MRDSVTVDREGRGSTAVYNSLVLLGTNEEDIDVDGVLYLHRASWVPGCLRRGLCDRTFGLSLVIAVAVRLSLYIDRLCARPKSCLRR